MTSKEDQAKILLMQQNLAALRGHAGWTAQRLADEIGVSKQTISNIETGKSSLTKTQYLAMRTVFNFEALERNNVRLAQALHDLVDEPAPQKAKSLSGNKHDITDKKTSLKQTGEAIRFPDRHDGWLDRIDRMHDCKSRWNDSGRISGRQTARHEHLEKRYRRNRWTDV